MGGPCRIVKDVDQTLLPMSQSILYIVKKSLVVFLSPAEMSLIKLSLCPNLDPNGTLFARAI